MIKMKSEYSISIGIHPKIQFSNNNSIYQVNLKFIIARFSRRKMISFSQNVKDHLCSIIPWPIRWQEYDTLQMILGILGHCQRVSSSPAPVAGI